MLLFDSPEYEKFFNPLCCKNKRIYYECINLLIEKSKQVTLLYENDARDSLTLYFRNLAYAVIDEEGENADEAISSKKTETENAMSVLRYFRHCGWISNRELGRNGDNIATVNPYCRKVIDGIERVFNRDNSAALTNHIFAIFDILSSAFKEDHARNIRPYSSILVPLSENVDDLKNELLTLKDSIRSIMGTVLKMTDTNQLGRFLIRDDMMETFFNEYFFIKKDGLIPGYIDEIEKMIRRLVKTDVYERMIKEYQEKNNTTELEAEQAIERYFAEIRSFISYEYAKEMDYIDKRINNYYNLYSTRMRMVLSDKGNWQTYLNDLLLMIKQLDPEEKRIFLSDVSNSFKLDSYRYIGRKSIERRKKRRPNVNAGKVIQSELSEEERKRLTEELLKDKSDKYGVKQTKEYFDNLFTEGASVAPKDIVKSRTDAMMLAACIIYAGSDDFPYEVEFLGGTVETGIATISDVLVKRKNK